MLILYGFGILLFYEKGKPVVRGFYCHDNSINQPFHEGTVSFKAVLFITFVLALICFMIVEFLKSRENITDLNSITDLIANRTIVTRVLVLCFLLLNATVTTVFITDIGKYTVGRLRPNYLSICEPDWSKINCTPVHGLQQAIYGDDHCKTTNLKKLKSTRLSFPSGHASFSSKHNFNPFVPNTRFFYPLKTLDLVLNGNSKKLSVIFNNFVYSVRDRRQMLLLIISELIKFYSP